MSAGDGRRGGVGCKTRPLVLAARSKLGHSTAQYYVVSARKAQILRPRQSNP